MVSGPSHSVMGLSAGLAAPLAFEAAAGIDVATGTVLAFAGITAGTSIFADLDHHRSTATRSLGPVTGFISHTLRAVSVATFHATRKPHDRDRDATHRGITHSAFFAVLTGVAVSVLCSVTWNDVGFWSTLALLFFSLLLALRALPPRSKLGADYVMSAGLTAVTYFTLPPGEVGYWLGAAYLLGTVVHCAGDALTYYAVPFWAPFSWKLRGMPRFLRFAADGPGDRVVFVLFSAVAVLQVALMVPGMADLLGSLWQQAMMSAQ